MAPTDMKICSFNCRSVKNSLLEVRQLCDSHQIILLQEHWLMPFDLHLLSEIHPDFLAFGTSAVNVSSGILLGRPYDGTAILYSKHLADRLSYVPCNDPRVSAVIFKSSSGPILIVNVYMPTEIEVCGSTRTRGYTRPDPTRTRGYRSGMGRCLTGRVGYGYNVHGYGYTRFYP